MPSFEHYDENEQALHDPCIVLRDSLGPLAVQILVANNDISNLSNNAILDKLYNIICDLQKTYEHEYANYTG